MSEWWTYTLSDFLMFSPKTYYRLFELYNRDMWPAQCLALAAGAATVVLLGRAVGARWVAAILTAAWLWVAWAFHHERYATINWGAVYAAYAFAVQGALLAWLGLVRGRVVFEAPRAARYAGMGIALFAVVGMPLLAPLAGRPLAQAELFGLAPDPTAVATLGVLLAASNRSRWLLAIVPVLWCAASALTLLAMHAPQWLVPALVLLLTASVALAVRRR